MKRAVPATDDAKRRYIMSRIGGKDTTIEILLRKALWHSGIRYRKNYTKLPGTPDIAITKHKIAIFCDGEFWHGKDWVSKNARIQSNRDYWIRKIERNIDRDNDVNRRLCNNGWTVLRFWGSQIRNNLAGCVEDIKDTIFLSDLESYFTGSDTYDLYPCQLLCNDNESYTIEAEQPLYNDFGLACFNTSAEM